MKTIITIGLLLVSLQAFPQKNNVDSLSRDLGWLLKEKLDYEKFKKIAEGRLERYGHLRDSSYIAYLARINKIKRSSAQYIKYIDGRLQNPELDKELLLYNYVDPLLSFFDPNEYTISLRDFYRVIKHTLLERNAKVLPETLDDIPFPVRRDYIEFKSQTQEGTFGPPKKPK